MLLLYEVECGWVVVLVDGVSGGGGVGSEGLMVV